MRVVSYFDGISCGQIALNRAGITYDNYIASEIDRHCIKITNKNYPRTVQVGCIKTTNIKRADLVLAGSPCQGFSFSGKELNFKDTRSALFFDFVERLEKINPTYFLLENVVMREKFSDIITKYMGVSPIMIDSKFFSAQKRRRLYWTNIPIAPYDDLGIKLEDILDEPGLGARRVGRRIKNGKRCDHDRSIKIKQRTEINLDPTKSNCLTTVKKDNVIVNGDTFRYLTVNEYEKLQTVPVDYTEGVSNTQRYKALGNAWTVDVIAHILKGIKNG